MSVQAITAALAIKGVTSSEKLLLIVLANYADEEMKCWPSHSRLSAETCLSQRQVLRVFAQLEAKSLLSRKARHVKNMRTTDMITLCLGGDTMSQRGDTVSGGVGTPRRQGGDTMSYRTLKEPLIEPSAVASPLPAEGQAQRRPEDADMKALFTELAKDLRGGRNEGKLGQRGKREAFLRKAAQAEKQETERCDDGAEGKEGAHADSLL